MNPSMTEDSATSCRTTITIPRNDYDLLLSIAEGKHVSLAWMIREAIRTYLDQQTPLFRRAEESKNEQARGSAMRRSR
jgi:predicted transcriptional regulator